MMPKNYDPFKQKVSFIHRQLQEKIKILVDKFYTDHNGSNYEKIAKISGGNKILWKHYCTMDLDFINEQPKKLLIPNEETLEKFLKHHGFRVRVIVEGINLPQ